MDYAALARSLVDSLALRHAPVAVSFVERAPDGVPRVAGGAPASCGYWPRAAAGEVFHTVADDHQRCPIGAHTHGVPLAPAAADELGQLIEQMVALAYLGADEVAQIPTRKQPFAVAVYAPLDRAPVAPDVVVVRGGARSIMLLVEAARAAGVDGGELMGRPACAMLPRAIDSARGQASLGCVGNRVYTALADDEMYYALPGPHLAPVVEKLSTIAAANQALFQLHTDRAHRFSMG